jgi:hypothetical protein
MSATAFADPETATATERIVVQATPAEKRAISSKAKTFGISVGELMRLGANAYTPDTAQDELASLADAAHHAAERACVAIDDSLDFIAASNARIAKLERR